MRVNYLYTGRVTIWTRRVMEDITKYVDDGDISPILGVMEMKRLDWDLLNEDIEYLENLQRTLGQARGYRLEKELRHSMALTLIEKLYLPDWPGAYPVDSEMRAALLDARRTIVTGFKRGNKVGAIKLIRSWGERRQSLKEYKHKVDSLERQAVAYVIPFWADPRDAREVGFTTKAWEHDSKG